ncbi:MAG: hypothetical protein OEV79_07940 [candidate division WOR-3 bacterium]|nr:hypothetical protein [candidate division WOR-3 bacterium]
MANVSVEEPHICMVMFCVTKNLYGKIEAEKVVEHGRLIISVLMVATISVIARFYVGNVIKGLYN